MAFKKSKQQRLDRQANYRTVAEKHRARVLKEQQVCAICGRPVDKSLKYPDPNAPVVDHWIPLARGGSVLDYSNYKLAHARCNRLKSDKLPNEINADSRDKEFALFDNQHVIEWSLNWLEYKTEKDGTNNSSVLLAQTLDLEHHGKRFSNRGIIQKNN